MIKKIIISTALSFLFFLPVLVLASENNENEKEDLIFKARVLEVLEQVEKESDNQEIIIQQDIKLLGLEGDFKNKEIFYYGIGDVELIGAKIYNPGDNVLVLATNLENPVYYVIDYVRSNKLFFIVLIFAIILFIVGKWKGLRSLISLLLTFVVIIFFIIPNIMAGLNPVLITFLGSLVILLVIIYLTEGFNLRSHVALASTFISLLLVIFISFLFISLTKLTGVFSDDVFILLNIGGQSINLKGMLLAGMIIGALGVLDDVVISQVAAVEQLSLANPSQSWTEVFKKAYQIGISHISSMTNTLFLAYAGASLPLLLLFVSPDSPFGSFEQIINNEAIATEIVRALSGSLGIILSVPLATLIASWFFVYRQKNN